MANPGGAGNGERAKRPHRWVPIVVIAALTGLIGYAIVAISVGTGGHVVVELDGSEAVQELYGGLFQDETTLGNRDAPVTVQLFVDIQCRSCAKWWMGVVPKLVDDYVREGKINIELHHFSQGTRTTELAGIGAAAAAKQGREFQFAHLFMLNLDKVPKTGVSDEYLLRVASAVPRMDAAQWQDDFKDPAAEEAARKDNQLATEQRFPVGDAVVVEGPASTERLIQDPSLAEVRAAIAKSSGP